MNSDLISNLSRHVYTKNIYNMIVHPRSNFYLLLLLLCILSCLLCIFLFLCLAHKQKKYNNFTQRHNSSNKHSCTIFITLVQICHRAPKTKSCNRSPFIWIPGCGHEESFATRFNLHLRFPSQGQRCMSLKDSFHCPSTSLELLVFHTHVTNPFRHSGINFLLCYFVSLF